MDEFIAFVGDPDIHDSTIVSIQTDAEDVRVTLERADGQPLLLLFRGVTSLKAHRAEGMMVYALSELRAEPPSRRFVFPNWDEDDDAFLELIAQDFSISIQDK